MQKINPALYVSPNDGDNSSVTEAKSILDMLSGFGLAFDTVSVLQGSNAQGPEDEITFRQLLGANPPADGRYFIIGRYKGDADSKAYTLAKDRALIVIPQDDGSPDKEMDGLNSFIELYTDRHPGASRAQAEAAADDIPAVQAAVKLTLDTVRALVK